MAITLKEECIFNEWSQMIDHGAGNGSVVMKDIQTQLTEAQIPGGCTWSVEEVVIFPVSPFS